MQIAEFEMIKLQSGAAVLGMKTLIRKIMHRSHTTCVRRITPSRAWLVLPRADARRRYHRF